jgi:hypothetical protein
MREGLCLGTGWEAQQGASAKARCLSTWRLGAAARALTKGGGRGALNGGGVWEQRRKLRQRLPFSAGLPRE